MGDNNSKSIPWAYRYSHESYLGIVDLDATSPSDPGVTGIICPYTKLYDGSFSEFEEPNTWKDMYKKLLDEFHRLIGVKESIIMKATATGKEPDLEKLESVDLVLAMTEDNMRLVNDILNERSVNTLVCPIIDLNQDGMIVLKPIDIPPTNL